jgi:solute carrier family 39 (zinc transporter), member 1/2/3
MNIDLAKTIVMLALGFGSLFMGLLPAVLSRYNLRRNQLLQTILLCFGAGILLATALVHMLPEVIVLV